MFKRELDVFVEHTACSKSLKPQPLISLCVQNENLIENVPLVKVFPM